MQGSISWCLRHGEKLTPHVQHSPHEMDTTVTEMCELMCIAVAVCLLFEH